MAGEDRVGVSSTPSEREFSDFYAEWRDPIRRALALAIGDIALADDATDEAMTRALASWAKIHNDRNAGDGRPVMVTAASAFPAMPFKYTGRRADQIGDTRHLRIWRMDGASIESLECSKCGAINYGRYNTCVKCKAELSGSPQNHEGRNLTVEIVCPECRTPSDVSGRAVCPSCHVKLEPGVWGDTPLSFLDRQKSLRQQIGSPNLESSDGERLLRWAGFVESANSPGRATALVPMGHAGSDGQGAKRTPPERYPALRTLSRVYSALGWVMVVAGVAFVGLLFGLLTTDDLFSDWNVWAIVGVFGGVALVYGLGALVYFSVAELINLGVDLEANTRRTSDLISRLHTTLTRQSTVRQR